MPPTMAITKPAVARGLNLVLPINPAIAESAAKGWRIMEVENIPTIAATKPKIASTSKIVRGFFSLGLAMVKLQLFILF